MVCTVIRDRLWVLDFSCMFTDEGYATINYHTLKSHDLRGGYPQFTPLPLGNFARLPPGSSSVPILHSGMYPWVENCTQRKKIFFQSTQQNHSASACMCAYGSSGQNASHYTLSYFSPMTAKEADQILVLIATF